MTASSQPDPAMQARVAESYGKLPLGFEANHEQADAPVKFLSRTAGHTLFVASAPAWAQGVQPYPNAFTDRAVHPKTPMAPPPINTVFQDPDFGAFMVRVTDDNTNPKKSSTASSEIR